MSTLAIFWISMFGCISFLGATFMVLYYLYIDRETRFHLEMMIAKEEVRKSNKGIQRLLRRIDTRDTFIRKHGFSETFHKKGTSNVGRTVVSSVANVEKTFGKTN